MKTREILVGLGLTEKKADEIMMLMIPTDIHITHHFDLDGDSLRRVIDELREILNRIEGTKHLVDMTKVPIRELPVSVRCRNVLRAADFKTLGDVTKCTKWELSRLRNFGKKAITELESVMEQYGLNFRE